MKKAIILLSGGIDSSVCAAIAKSEGYELYGLTINYGQIHSKELEYAKKVSEHFNFKKHVVLGIPDLKNIAKSSLTSEKIEIPVERDLKTMTEEIPNTYVPGRNIIFLALASSFCETVDADTIFVGFNQLDYSGYPDCRNEFVKAMEGVVNQGIAKSVNGDEKIKIIAPLIDLNKRDIILKGKSLGVDFSKIWTCYKGEEKPCGKCDACKLRIQGFKEACVEDPLLNKKQLSKVYFVTGNKYKIEIFNKVMKPEYAVNSFVPEEEIVELDSRSVMEVVVDKAEKAYNLFPNLEGFLFVTDVGLYIEQLEGRPGAFIKRETKKLFDGDFQKWCSYLDDTKTRSAYIQMIIAAKDSRGRDILVDHKVKGFISKEPQPGEFGFAWDDIFVPESETVSEEYKNKSFAQIPEDIKFSLLMDPAIKEFKNKILEIDNE